MFKKSLTLIAAGLAVSFAASVGAQSFDARSMGMGGIGASTSGYLTASFHNPALLARFDDADDIGILLPYVGAQVQDEAQLVDQLEGFSDLYSSLNISSSPDDAQQAIDALKKMQGDKAYAQAGVGSVIAVPSQLVSFSLFVKSYVDSIVIADIAENDLILSNIMTSGELESQGVTMGVAISEVGASFSKSFDTNYGVFYAGISPKYQQVDTINYVVNIDQYEFDDWDDEKYRNKDGNFNADIGLAFSFDEVEYLDNIILGFVAKNLIKNEYDTVVLANGVKGTYVINPTYTTSISYNTDLLTVGIDVDLNETERYENVTGLKSGYVDSEKDNTQLAGTGIEFNAWNWAQIRAGYQYDISGTIESQYTAGLGFSPWGVFHMDLGATYAGDNQFGASLQTAFTF